MRTATNIEWVINGTPEEFDLPNEIVIPNSISNEDVADYLSDIYGFLVESFVIE